MTRVLGRVVSEKMVMVGPVQGAVGAEFAPEEEEGEEDSKTSHSLPAKRQKLTKLDDVAGKKTKVGMAPLSRQQDSLRKKLKAMNKQRKG